MIRINLLPHREEARKARRQQFFVMLGGVAALSALVVFLGYTIINGYISSQDESNAFLKREIAVLDKQIEQCYRQNALCQRIGKIPGIGPVTASALIATIGKANNFENGRQLAAWLGLVPRQHSSGGKQVLLGISKRGDTYLRTLLIHGARAVLQSAKHKQDAVSSWANQLMARRNNNIASVALANKNARTVWALLAKEREYCAPIISA